MTYRNLIQKLIIVLLLALNQSAEGSLSILPDSVKKFMMPALCLVTTAGIDYARAFLQDFPPLTISDTEYKDTRSNRAKIFAHMALPLLRIASLSSLCYAYTNPEAVFPSKVDLIYGLVTTCVASYTMIAHSDIECSKEFAYRIKYDPTSLERWPDTGLKEALIKTLSEKLPDNLPADYWETDKGRKMLGDGFAILQRNRFDTLINGLDALHNYMSLVAINYPTSFETNPYRIVLPFLKNWNRLSVGIITCGCKLFAEKAVQAIKKKTHLKATSIGYEALYSYLMLRRLDIIDPLPVVTTFFPKLAPLAHHTKMGLLLTFFLCTFNNIVHGLFLDLALNQPAQKLHDSFIRPIFDKIQKKISSNTGTEKSDAQKTFREKLIASWYRTAPYLISTSIILFGIDLILKVVMKFSFSPKT